MLFIADRRFCSAGNPELLSTNGSAYIIPLAGNLRTCRKAVSSLDMTERFVYQKGRKAAVVEYKDEIIEGQRVLIFRDLDESTAEQANYIRHIDRGEAFYTTENLLKLKDFMDVTVLQTSMTAEAATAEDIFTLYQKRRSREPFYNYCTNDEDCKVLYQEDYCKAQGLAFILLISALVHRELQETVSKVNWRTLQDCLMEAQMVKIHRDHGR